MEPIRISSPADAISYMGHSLGYWPKESLVCVALEGKTLGPTLRVNLPGTTDLGRDLRRARRPRRRHRPRRHRRPHRPVHPPTMGPRDTPSPSPP